MKKKILLSVVMFTMLALFILFIVVFRNYSFFEWIIYFPVVPFIFSLIGIFSEKERRSYRGIIVVTIVMLLSFTMLSACFNITYVYQILSTLAGCGMTLVIAYYLRKQT
jgi:predicted membrane protein